jgi:hypothetical protein
MPACGRRCSAAEGRMVFLSSRVLSEVERIADRVGIICEGRLVDLLEVSALKTRALRRFELHFARPVPPAAFDRLPGGSWSRSRGDMVRCAVEGSIDALIKAAASHELVSLVSHGRTWRRSSWPTPPGIAGFLVNSLSALAEGLKQWRPLTLFYQYAGNDPLRNGLDVGDAAVLLAVARRWRWSRWSPSSAATWPPERRPAAPDPKLMAKVPQTQCLCPTALATPEGSCR